ncbi:MAG: 2,3-bisphosphoglycerate-independent phosphoglycerate mutase [bacterium]
MSNYQNIIDELTIENDTKIIFFIMDGIGGLHMGNYPGTELEMAKTPNLDVLVKKSSCGLLIPVSPGVTPGSGPGHFALFGYEPLESNIGRGVLEAAGISFHLTDKDLAVRGNFATVDKDGNIVDRRAGRIPTDENKRICQKLRENIKLDGVEVIIETVKDHRFLLVLRGDGLEENIFETDPQITGVPALDPEPLRPEAKKTADMVKEFIHQAKEILTNEKQANMITLRGFAKHRPYKSMKERYKLKALCIANYPMYRGVSFLIGMDIHPVTPDILSQFEALEKNYNKYDFIFLHVKTTDATGEDGNFEAKVKAIEELDAMIPKITRLNPDVLVITGDHSTPSALRSHSWHPVPVLLYSKYARIDRVERFNELECLKGALGQTLAQNLMAVALAHALRLKKFGA